MTTMNAAAILRSRVITSIASGALVSVIGLLFIPSDSTDSSVLTDSGAQKRGDSSAAGRLKEPNEPKIVFFDPFTPASYSSPKGVGQSDDFIFTAPLTSEF